jgi:hypothetical protein
MKRPRSLSHSRLIRMAPELRRRLDAMLSAH